MPPLSDSSKEQREEDEESGFGDLPDLDLQLGPHREEAVGSHAEPPAPRPTPPTQPESAIQETEDEDVAHKLETDLRLSEDETQEADKLTCPQGSPPPSANSTIPPLTPREAPTELHGMQLQADTQPSLEQVNLSPRPDTPTHSGLNEELRFEPADDWPNPPEIVEISGGQMECSDSDSGDSSSSSGTYNTKLEVGL